MRIALLGAPGSGKGTQIARLVKKYKVPQLHLSEVLRVIAATESPLGHQVKEVMEGGHLLSDELMLLVYAERLKMTDTRDGFILNGFPRNLNQAEVLDNLLEAHEVPLDAVLLLELDDDTLLERVGGRRTCRDCGAVFNIFTDPPRMDDQCDACGGSLHRRADDRESAIDNRLRVYNAHAEPIANYYQQQGKLHRVEADGDSDTVFKRICQRLQRALALARSLKKTQPKPAAKKPPAKAEAPAKAASPKAAPKKAVPKKAAPKKAAPKKAAPKKAAPKKAAPKKAAPKKAAPKKAAPKKAAPKKAAPKKAVQKKAATKKKAAARKKK